MEWFANNFFLSYLSCTLVWCRPRTGEYRIELFLCFYCIFLRSALIQFDTTQCIWNAKFIFYSYNYGSTEGGFETIKYLRTCYVKWLEQLICAVLSFDSTVCSNFDFSERKYRHEIISNFEVQSDKFHRKQNGQEKQIIRQIILWDECN